MKLAEFVRRLEPIIPLSWALPEDPVGLQIGDPEQEVKRVIVTLEVSTRSAQKAIAEHADVLLAHHPLIYRPLWKLLADNPVQRLAGELIRNRIALYAAHTNFDLHPQGMAGVWAKRLGCIRAKPLAAKPQAGQLKLVTFVPAEYTDSVRQALAQAGAGRIGDYDLCSFTTQGIGTFRGSEKTNPFIGQAGVFEKQEEERLEMILPAHKQTAVVNALYASHPYEEPAYDLYPLQDVRGLRQALWTAEFKKKLSWSEFAQRVAQSLPAPVSLGGVRPDRRRKVQRIAISTGSANDLIATVADLEIDAYLTGEVGYHYLWEAEERRLNVMTVGHGASECWFSQAVLAMVAPAIDEITWIRDDLFLPV